MCKTAARLLGIVVLILPLASCGKVGNPALLGEWEAKANNKTSYLTFEKDGHLELGGDVTSLGNVFTALTILTDFGIHPGKNTPITYKCVGDAQLEIEGDFTALLEKLSAGGTGQASPDAMQKLHPKETLTYAVTGKELTLTNSKGKSTTFRKVE